MRLTGINLIVAAAVLLVTSFPTVQSAFSLTGDFITGFESGIFLRNNPKMFEDYGCPDAENNNAQFRQF
jgi:hypothetical protein